MLATGQQRSSRSRALPGRVVPVFDAKVPLVQRVPPGGDVARGDDAGSPFYRPGGIADDSVFDTQSRTVQPVGGRGDAQSDDDKICRHLRAVAEADRFDPPITHESVNTDIDPQIHAVLAVQVGPAWCQLFAQRT
ncbi:hypothetical protein A5636_23915 [Mycobacterium asiaticum]|uniref:Uncharacterized protein n=1 Tax=Mycobacterium asiaticum TaxID=1790 RepID=A0A1A3N4Z0_MYCAS|nr:hypothetical protein A5636_23915 [Mycobacterium asiaticum]